MDSVLITGAGGFVGGQVRALLAADPALRIVAATRDGRDGTLQLDLLGPGLLARAAAALAGVDAVVHCAVGNRAVTVDGTLALLRAAAAAGVRRFVHVSSVAVYGAATGRVAEDTPFVASDRPGYAGWKAAAERACLAQTGLEVVRLRPAIIYGPDSVPWVSHLARRIRSGRWGVFGAAGGGTCNLVHVADVARAVAAALSAPGAGGRAFNVNGPEQITWNDWFVRLAEAIGAPALRRVSPGALRARSLLALPLKAAARLRPGLAGEWLLGAPAASELALFALRATYPSEAAAALGWRPSIGVAAGLASCLGRLREVA